MCGVVGHGQSHPLSRATQAVRDCDVHGPNRPVVGSDGGLSPLEAPPASNVHVLLVDDERLTRTVVANLLHKCGYRVTSASDGMEALQLLRGSAPDTFQLVLTDVCMPELNGLQLLNCVKQDANLRAVPVVMMSSMDQQEAVAAAVQNGAEEYLVKPVTKKEVQHIWQHVWRKRCAAATVPQLPQEAAAAVAAAAAAAASQQQQQRQDVQQPAAASMEQQQPAMMVLPVPVAGSCVDALIRSTPQPGAASLHQRQAVFSAAVAMVQAAHLQQRPLLCLRPSRLLFSQQHGLSVSTAGGSISEADALYASPEEAVGRTDCRCDMFSLGLLFLDLFFPCASQEQRCAQLRAARAAVLPAVLAGTHTAGSTQAVQDLLQGLLQADPAQRPSVHAVLRAGILADAYRLVAVLPHWRLLLVAAPAPLAAVPAASSAAAPAAAATAAAAPSAAAATGTAAATAAPGGAVDHEAVRHFLLLLRKSKQQELVQAQVQLAALDVDIGNVVARRRQRSASPSPSVGPGQARGEQQELPGSKRARVEEAQKEEEEEVVEPIALIMAAEEGTSLLSDQQQQRVAAVMPQLEEIFFQRRQQQQLQPLLTDAAAKADVEAARAQPPTPSHLQSFAHDLNELANHSRLSLKATLRSGDLASPVEMACCAAFDRDDEFFATVGVSRRVKIFDFKACLGEDSETGSSSVMHYPALQITTRSKLSSVSWNSYVKSQLITSDYSGLIQLWDASTAGEAAQYDEHARRVWSVDFSTTDPMRFLSGSDDGSVRLWSVADQSSVARIAAPANVCSVQFSPADCHTIAFGCANYRVYLYDLRNTAHPLAVIAGPQRAVSYVKFLGGHELVSASTDSTLRLWDLREVLTSTSAASVSTASGGSSISGGCGGGSGRCRPACTYMGHRNQRNFVGLSVTPDGHILCGSEDNSVYAYYRSLPFSTAQYRFGPAEAPAIEGHQPFVSAVCWANRSRHCLAANSQGLLQILKLE